MVFTVTKKTDPSHCQVHQVRAHLPKNCVYAVTLVVIDQTSEAVYFSCMGRRNPLTDYVIIFFLTDIQIICVKFGDDWFRVGGVPKWQSSPFSVDFAGHSV